MYNDNFFAGWENPTTNSAEISIQFTDQDSILKSEEHLQFECDSEEYFQSNGENSIQLIPQFLNEELIENDPASFIYGYKKILQQICFSDDKVVAVDTLCEIITASNGTREEMAKFIIDSGLADKTERVFKILKMEKEWDTVNEILNSGPIEKNI